MVRRSPAAFAVAGFLAVAGAAWVAYGESAERQAEQMSLPPEMAKPLEGEAPKADAAQAPLFSFERGELALLRKLAMRRKELEDRESRLVERERLAAAMEDADARAGFDAIAPQAGEDAIDADGLAEHLQRERAHTLGDWGEVAPENA